MAEIRMSGFGAVLRKWSVIICSLPIALTATSAPAACSAAGRERIQVPGLDYQRIAFTASTIDPADPAYAWESEWGRIHLDSGSLISSADPALFQLLRYDPVHSMGLVRSGRFVLFIPVSFSDRTVADLRLAVAPSLTGGSRYGASGLVQPRAGVGPRIGGYRFQMAEALAGEHNTSLGLWRRTGRAGARTLLVLLTSRADLPSSYQWRIVGRSDLAFSLISQTTTQHGGDWGFTLFTEASCPGPIAILRYGWFLHLPQLGRR